jgi:ABC-2 type transport system permease protein
MQAVRVAFEFLKIRLNAKLVFRTSTLAGLLTSVLTVWVSVFVILGAIYSRVDSILGWSKADIVVLQGIMFLIVYIYNTFAQGGIDRIGSLVEGGDLDAFLTRPINLKLTILFLEPDIKSSLQILVGIVTIFYGLKLGHVVPDAVTLTIFMLSLILSYILYVEVQLLFHSLMFWVYRLYSLYVILDEISQYGRYPAEIYGKALRFVLLSVFPLAVVSNYPAKILLGRMNAGGIFYQFVIVGVFWGLIEIIWKLGLKHYESVGT